MIFSAQIFQEVNLVSTLIRLLLAVIFGGIIGLERSANKHAAGFRTYIMVCVGATLTMLTNQFIMETIAPASDPARMGAQVISGIGFLGVGTIIMTGRNKIRGLTTAAGLWASACVGLALGVGFYEGAIAAAIIIFLAFSVFDKIEKLVNNKSSILNLYIELDSIHKINDLQESIREQNIYILDLHVSKAAPVNADAIGVHLNLRLPNKCNPIETISEISKQNGVCFIEEI